MSNETSRDATSHVTEGETDPDSSGQDEQEQNLASDDDEDSNAETSVHDNDDEGSESEGGERAGDETAGDESTGDESAYDRTFDDLNLQPEIMQALDEMGYENPMPVQVAVYDHMMAGKDIMVQSRTGSGKTAGFGIPIAQMLDTQQSGAQALILAPTRELALQVSRELDRLVARKGLVVVPVYGGAPMKPQIDALRGGAQIVAGTPGRVLDHLRRGTLKGEGIRMLVLDECDEMLSMGFQEEIEKIMDFLPAKEERQTVLFSATIPEEIQRIAGRHMTDPENISLSTDGVSVDEIDHFYYVVSGMARLRDLLKVIKIENPESAIIFCNTREDTNTVARFMRKNGYDAEAISSDLTQRDRERVMKRMRAGNLHFLVATDVAARGIDISNLSHVINYTFPESPEVYVHRTGRTGRAGKSGVAVSLVGPRELSSFYYLKLIYKIRPTERDLPSADELSVILEGERYRDVLARVTDEPEDEYRSLARRIWQSNEGERIVGFLLEKLLTATPQERAGAGARSDGAAAEAAREPRDERRTRSDRDDRRSRDERDDRDDRRARDDDRDARRADRDDRDDRDARRADRDDRRTRSERNGRDERRSRADRDDRRSRADRDDRRSRADRDDRDARRSDRDARRSDRDDRRSRADRDDRDARRSERDDRRSDRDDRRARRESVDEGPERADRVEATERADRGNGHSERRDRDDDTARRKRRRQRDEVSESRASAQRESASVVEPEPDDTRSAYHPDDPDSKEFWESWADEVTTQRAARAEAEPEIEPEPKRHTSRRAASNVRLYVNLGKREELTASRIREILGDGMGSDADRIGSIALRNTHCYVRVPEEIADKLIDLAAGKSFKDREIVVERARR